MYDEGVAERLREHFADRNDNAEKKMFGGIAFMHSGNMCCGIVNDVLMAREGPDTHAEALARLPVREMDFTGKSLTGFLYVDPPGFAEDDDLASWLAFIEDRFGEAVAAEVRLEAEYYPSARIYGRPYERDDVAAYIRDLRINILKSNTYQESR